MLQQILNMKKEEKHMFRSILSLIAGASLHVAAFSANSVCFLIYYEPKMPEGMSKLIKEC